MEDLIDDNLVQINKEDNSNLTQNIKLRTLIYFSIMLLGGVFYSMFFTKLTSNIFHYFYHSFVIIGASIILGSVLLFIRILIRKWRNKRKGLQIEYDPIWFEVIENGISLWLFLMFFSIIGVYI